MTTWIGPAYILTQPAIVPSDESANYGANVDEWLRTWIVNENLQARDALFPITVHYPIEIISDLYLSTIWNILNKFLKISYS